MELKDKTILKPGGTAGITLDKPDTRVLSVSTILGKLQVLDSGPAEGKTALLWPSLFSDGQTSWGAQLTGLHELGWRTLLVNPPGTGSSQSATRAFTMEECAKTLSKFSILWLLTKRSY